MSKQFEEYAKTKALEEEKQWEESDDDEDKIRAPKYDIIYSYPVDLGVNNIPHFVNFLGILGSG